MVVLLPVLLETALLLAIAALLHDSEEQTMRAERSKQVVFQAHSLITAVSDAGTALYTSNLFHRPTDNYDALMAEIPVKQAELKRLVGEDQFEIACLSRIDEQIKIGMGLMEEAKSLMAKHDETPGLWRIAKMPKRFKDCVTSIIANVESIDSYEKKKQTASPEELLSQRAFINQFLFFGVGANVILAVWLAIAVSRGLTRRVDVLTENTIRMQNGTALLPPQKGDDEIAKLDAFFHSMAQTLREAAEREEEAKAVLQANEAKIRSVIENILIGLIIADPKGNIDFANPTAEKLLEYPRAHICQLKLYDLFQIPNSDERVQLDKLPPGKTIELEARSSIGKSIPVESTVSRFTTNDGERILISILDIRERKEIEQLRKNLVAVVSHDLRSPLGSVMAFLEVLIRGSFGQLNERGLKLANRAEDELRRLMKLILDLLDLAKMESGKIEVFLSDTDLAKVLDRSVQAVEGLASKNEITIKRQETRYILLADEDRLIQVMVNLLSNAIKFSPAQTAIEIIITAVNNYAEISVIDQGKGIAKEMHEKIFKQFEQGPSSQAAQGVGLGLAICKSIVEAHSGSIGVESAVGKGSRFWVRIPLARAKSAD